MPPALERTLLLIPAALLAGLITKDTFTTGQDIVIDARLAGVSVAILATWRKMPLVVVIVLGVGTTAALRALS
jgi:branched-subunit amino acid transport protein